MFEALTDHSIGLPSYKNEATAPAILKRSGTCKTRAGKSYKVEKTENKSMDEHFGEHEHM